MQVRQRKRLLMQGRSRRMSLLRHWQLVRAKQIRDLVYASRVQRRWAKRLMPSQQSYLSRMIDGMAHRHLTTLTRSARLLRQASQSTHPQD